MAIPKVQKLTNYCCHPDDQNALAKRVEAGTARWHKDEKGKDIMGCTAYLLPDPDLGPPSIPAKPARAIDGINAMRAKAKKKLAAESKKATKKKAGSK